MRRPKFKLNDIVLVNCEKKIQAIIIYAYYCDVRKSWIYSIDRCGKKEVEEKDLIKLR